MALLGALVSLNANAQQPLGSNNQIQTEVDKLREQFAVPALWVGKFCDDGRVAIAASGVRKFGNETPVAPDDLVHIGSCTKAMTAALIAQLITEKSLRFDSTLAEIFPEVVGLSESAWAQVTVNELLQHCSGAPANANWTAIDRAYANDPRAARQATLEWLIKTKRPKKRSFTYSNVGYVLLGHIVEQIDGRPWEQAIVERLFKPLKIESAGFGPVGELKQPAAATVDFPFGHTVQMNFNAILTEVFGSKKKLSFQPTQIDNPPVMNPAGRVHIKIDEWSRFVLLFASKVPAPQIGISPEVWTQLLKPEFGGLYAGGWVIDKPSWTSGEVLWHNGSNTTWYALAYALPEKGCCIIAVSNAYCSQAEQACTQAVEAISKIELRD